METQIDPSTKQEKIFSPSPKVGTVIAADGTIVQVPAGWGLLKPGDAALTKRVKAAGDYWLVQKKVGRKIFSGGIFANSETIQRITAELEAERSTEAYARRKVTQAKYREKVQDNYVDEFFEAVCKYLNFHPIHADKAKAMARAITEHATPVGSGTVARTKRIPINKRASKAVIAWMRHATTDYDNMKFRGITKRREVREDLAKESRRLLQNYRAGHPVAPDCPLMKAILQRSAQTP